MTSPISFIWSLIRSCKTLVINFIFFFCRFIKNVIWNGVYQISRVLFIFCFRTMCSTVCLVFKGMCMLIQLVINFGYRFHLSWSLYFYFESIMISSCLVFQNKAHRLFTFFCITYQKLSNYGFLLFSYFFFKMSFCNTINYNDCYLYTNTEKDVKFIWEEWMRDSKVLLNKAAERGLIEVDVMEKANGWSFTNIADIFQTYKKATRMFSSQETSNRFFLPRPFTAAPSINSLNVPWFLDYAHLAGWFFFFTMFLLLMWIILSAVIFSRNVELRQPIRETRGFSRAQTGDGITAVIPMTWSITMLMHASTHSVNFDENTSGTVFTLTVIAYQWGWNYYFPKDIVEIFWCMPKIVGNGGVEYGCDFNYYDHLLEYYRQEKLNFSTLNGYGYNQYGKSTLQGLFSLFFFPSLVFVREDLMDLIRQNSTEIFKHNGRSISIRKDLQLTREVINQYMAEIVEDNSLVNSSIMQDFLPTKRCISFTPFFNTIFFDSIGYDYLDNSTPALIENNWLSLSWQLANQISFSMFDCSWLANIQKNCLAWLWADTLRSQQSILLSNNRLVFFYNSFLKNNLLQDSIKFPQSFNNVTFNHNAAELWCLPNHFDVFSFFFRYNFLYSFDLSFFYNNPMCRFDFDSFTYEGVSFENLQYNLWLFFYNVEYLIAWDWAILDSQNYFFHNTTWDDILIDLPDCDITPLTLNDIFLSNKPLTLDIVPGSRYFVNLFLENYLTFLNANKNYDSLVTWKFNLLNSELILIEDFLSQSCLFLAPDQSFDFYNNSLLFVEELGLNFSSTIKEGSLRENMVWAYFMKSLFNGASTSSSFLFSYQITTNEETFCTNSVLGWHSDINVRYLLDQCLLPYQFSKLYNIVLTEVSIRKLNVNRLFWMVGNSASMYFFSDEDFDSLFTEIFNLYSLNFSSLYDLGNRITLDISNSYAIQLWESLAVREKTFFNEFGFINFSQLIGDNFSCSLQFTSLFLDGASSNLVSSKQVEFFTYEKLDCGTSWDIFFNSRAVYNHYNLLSNSLEKTISINLDIFFCYKGIFNILILLKTSNFQFDELISGEDSMTVFKNSFFNYKWARNCWFDVLYSFYNHNIFTINNLWTNDWSCLFCKDLLTKNNYVLSLQNFDGCFDKTWFLDTSAGTFGIDTSCPIRSSQNKNYEASFLTFKYDGGISNRPVLGNGILFQWCLSWSKLVSIYSFPLFKNYHGGWCRKLNSFWGVKSNINTEQYAWLWENFDSSIDKITNYEFTTNTVSLSLDGMACSSSNRIFDSEFVTATNQTLLKLPNMYDEFDIQFVYSFLSPEVNTTRRVDHLSKFEFSYKTFGFTTPSERASELFQSFFLFFKKQLNTGDLSPVLTSNPYKLSNSYLGQSMDFFLNKYTRTFSNILNNWLWDTNLLGSVNSKFLFYQLDLLFLCFLQPNIINTWVDFENCSSTEFYNYCCFDSTSTHSNYCLIHKGNSNIWEVDLMSTMSSSNYFNSKIRWWLCFPKAKTYRFFDIMSSITRLDTIGDFVTLSLAEQSVLQETNSNLFIRFNSETGCFEDNYFAVFERLYDANYFWNWISSDWYYDCFLKYLEVSYNKNRKKSLFEKVRSDSASMRRLRVTKGICLPSDYPIHVICGSKDVIHSWAIPGLGVKIDCIPGFNSHRRVLFRWRGVYWGQCMEVCGRYHHWMPILIRIVHKDIFLSWCLIYIRALTTKTVSEASTEMLIDLLQLLNNKDTLEKFRASVKVENWLDDINLLESFLLAQGQVDV